MIQPIMKQISASKKSVMLVNLVKTQITQIHEKKYVKDNDTNININEPTG